jgi:hypothetical protein
MLTEAHQHGCSPRSVHDAEVIRDTMRDPTLCRAHDWHTVRNKYVRIGHTCVKRGERVFAHAKAHTATNGIKDHKLTDCDR